MICNDYIFQFPYTFDTNRLINVLANKQNNKNLLLGGNGYIGSAFKDHFIQLNFIKP